MEQAFQGTPLPVSGEPPDNLAVFGTLRRLTEQHTIHRLIGHWKLGDRVYILYNGRLYCSVRMAILLEAEGHVVELNFRRYGPEHRPYLALVRRNLRSAGQLYRARK